MYKLTIVGGPSRGTSYVLQDGENTIGRMSSNTIVLQSARISKRHCAIVVDASGIEVKDLGSSNGTFVNGVLTRSKSARPGDRISVGEYVFQIDNPSDRPVPRPPSANLGGLPAHLPRPPSPGAGGLPPMGLSTQNSDPVVPKALPDKLAFYFEHHIMPFFYSILLKNEWRMILASLVAALIIGTVLIALYPLLSANEYAIVRETGRRATFIAKQIAESNTPAIAAQANTKTDIGIAEKGFGVRVALLTDTDSRILAPAHRHGQYLTSGPEAIFAIQMRKQYEKGSETGAWLQLDSSTVAAIEPVKVYDNRMGKNLVRGMAIVSIDVTQSLPGSGETGVVYSQTVLIAAVLGLIIFMIIYRLTLRPFNILNDDLDKVLKSELPQVTHEYKLSELNGLWDLINSAVQRLPKSSGTSSASSIETAPQAAEDFSGAAHMIGDLGKFGLILCDSDRKIVYLNSLFEEISGIRADGASGQLIASVARDQSFAAFTSDLMDRSTGGDIVIEDYDFSGLFYKVHAVAFGARTGQAKGFLFLVVRTDS